MTRRIPITPRNCSVNGSTRAFPVEWWAGCDWSKAYVDPGPSPAGNAGPYLHVPHSDGAVNRVYPRLRSGCVVGVARNAQLGICWVVER